MKKALIFSILVVLVGYNCSTGNKKADNNKDSTTNIQTAKNEQIPLINPSDSGIIWLDMVNGEGIVQTRKKENQTIYVEFKSKGYKKLSAHLFSPDSLANIRFNQIFLPDGTMDGPFRKDLEYNIPSDGNYKISIHENMMAGDPWSGIFNIQVKLTK